MLKLPCLSNLIFLWWLIIIGLSLSGATEIYQPTQFATLIVLCGISCMVIGSYLSLLAPIKIIRFRIMILTLSRIKWILILIFLIGITPLYKATAFIFENGMDGFRSIAFSIDPETGESTVFGSLRYIFVVNNMIKPVAYAIFFHCIYLFFFENERRNLILSFFVVFILSISTFGRFFLYHILMVVLATFLLKISINNWVVGRKEMLKVFLLLSFFLVALVLFSFLRDVGNVFQSLIDYHVVGISIFSQELSEQRSIINGSDINFTSLGFIERLFVIGVNKFNLQMVSMVDYVETYLSAFRMVGRNTYYNAFSTWYFTLYLDGGIIYVFAYNLIYGFLLSYFERCFRVFKDAYSFMMTISLFFIAFFSVFTSIIQGPFILLPILSLLFACKFKKQ
ncbi:O-antigen polymerase [Aeromonas veronii]